MRAIPDYGVHMTVKAFIKACVAGGFIDYDGYANYATTKKVSDIVVYPSTVVKKNFVTTWTHVVWFNR